MTTVRELKQWLDALEPDEGVFIDDGGLTLRSESGAYFELGGEPQEDDQ